MTTKMQDFGAGAVFMAVGLYFSLGSLYTLQIGSASFMGPGYFPLWLGAILTVLGLIRTVKGFRAQWGTLGKFPLRGIVLIGLSPVIFGLTLEGLGFILSLFLATFVSSLSSEKVSPGFGLIIALGVTLLCVIVFHFGIGLTVPLIGRWIQ